MVCVRDAGGMSLTVDVKKPFEPLDAHCIFGHDGLDLSCVPVYRILLSVPTESDELNVK